MGGERGRTEREGERNVEERWRRERDGGRGERGENKREGVKRVKVGER